ncbi:hypothetical protein ACCS73_34545, partial [Rhizobium brockwellii]
TLITTNPHYHPWHPKDGGSIDSVSDSGRHYKTDYLVVHFLLDDVKETSPPCGAEARCGRKPHRRPVEAKLTPTLMTTAAISLSLA